MLNDRGSHQLHELYKVLDFDIQGFADFSKHLRGDVLVIRQLPDHILCDASHLFQILFLQVPIQKNMPKLLDMM